MQFDEYQKQAESFLLPTANDLNYLIPGLVAEAGEVAGHYAKFKRDGVLMSGRVDELILKELGDVMWFCALIADHYGVSLDYVAQQNIEKLASRRKRGVISGSGDNR